MAGRKRMSEAEKQALGPLVSVRAERLRNAMKQKRLTEAAVAAAVTAGGRVRISPAGVHYLSSTTGKRRQDRVRLAVLNELAQLLGRPWQYLSGERDEFPVRLELPGEPAYEIAVYTGKGLRPATSFRMPWQRIPLALVLGQFLDIGVWRRRLLKGGQTVAIQGDEGQVFLDHMMEAFKLIVRPSQKGAQFNQNGLALLGAFLQPSKTEIDPPRKSDGSRSRRTRRKKGSFTLRLAREPRPR